MRNNQKRRLPRLVAFIVSVFFLLAVPAAYSYEFPKTKKPLVDNGEVELLQKMSKGISSIAEKVNKGIVFVSVSKTFKGQPFGLINPFEYFFNQQRNPFDQKQAPEFKQKGLGSGFFVDLKKGYILTNNHVIEGADEIHLKLSNGENYKGKVVGRDKNTDVAVVQISEKKWNKKNLLALPLGNSDKVKVGDLCVAMGAPFGLEASLSLGTVSALGRGSLKITELGNFMQTDAAINPGNSGGPLINMKGHVIGINSAIYSKSGGYNGIGFAIPSNFARTVAEQLINEGKVERGYLGVYLGQQLDPELKKDLELPENTEGALISSVEPGGPADKAGIEPGDVIIDVDGKPIDDYKTLTNVIGLMKPKSKVKIALYRNGKKRTVSAVLGSFGQAATIAGPADAPFGLALSGITALHRSKYNFKSKAGAVVTAVSANSSADRAGIQVGDLLVKINNVVIKGPKEFWKQAKGKKRLLVRLERKGKFFFVPLRK